LSGSFKSVGWLGVAKALSMSAPASFYAIQYDEDIVDQYFFQDFEVDGVSDMRVSRRNRAIDSEFQRRCVLENKFLRRGGGCLALRLRRYGLGRASRSLAVRFGLVQEL